MFNDVGHGVYLLAFNYLRHDTIEKRKKIHHLSLKSLIRLDSIARDTSKSAIVEINSNFFIKQQSISVLALSHSASDSSK
ncbi:hypothetical protein GCM10011357_23440 [Lacimicrobium alkaliphilum]|uniref:Uncharacterized protein n=1 Tax=Lacimicrobium alkaliphilum TaxID=1526571 RepID=A0ABQ1RGI1_9ALTE|nr:hypothetical protein GCM10011357_23440 [Lacimicrobium alkaliphilum]